MTHFIRNCGPTPHSSPTWLIWPTTAPYPIKPCSNATTLMHLFQLHCSCHPLLMALAMLTEHTRGGHQTVFQGTSSPQITGLCCLTMWGEHMPPLFPNDARFNVHLFNTLTSLIRCRQASDSYDLIKGGNSEKIMLLFFYARLLQDGGAEGIVLWPCYQYSFLTSGYLTIGLSPFLQFVLWRIDHSVFLAAFPRLLDTLLRRYNPLGDHQGLIKICRASCKSQIVVRCEEHNWSASSILFLSSPSLVLLRSSMTWQWPTSDNLLG